MNDMKPTKKGTGTMELTTSQRQIMCQFVADYNGGEADDYHDDIDTTRDSFDRYDGASWARASEPIDGDGYGVPARHFGSVQVATGQPNYSVWIMDFGDFRAVCQL